MGRIKIKNPTSAVRSSRFAAPAAVRPILRGLGGDRLLMLENGQNTDDLSATSSDHACC